MLPNLLVIGAMKGGTTSLWEYLRQHPQIYMSPTKEIHFFDRDDRWARGAAWYAPHFAGATPQHAVVGEATPAYTRFPLYRDVPARAASLLPDAKLVYVLREPIARVRSHYLHHRSLGLETLPFAQAVVEHSTYVDTSRYAMQIGQWLRFYDRDQLLVLTSEQLRAEHATTMRRVYSFLGVDPDFRSTAEELHRTEEKFVPRPAANRLRSSKAGERFVESLPSSVVPALQRVWSLTRHRPDVGGADLDDRLRAVLTDLLHDDVRELRAYVGSDVDGWGL
ncbi:MAG TPA: sulfotransferase domain-containing protein [Mycobacteriales bacterium]|nr:sulfotransferase domain-containing protein [Mycobacteriales bacterium]